MRATDEATLLQNVCDIVVDVSGYRMSWVALCVDDEAKSVSAAARAGVDDGYLDSIAISWADVSAGRGPVGTSIREGRTVVVRDAVCDEAFGPWREAAAARGYRSVVSFPLWTRDELPLGAMSIYSSESDAFDEDELGLLEELAGDLNYGISNLRTQASRAEAEVQLEESYRRLERLTNDVVLAMGRVVEMRDPYTRGHEERTARLCKLFATEMGLPAEDIAAVEMAAMLHDIGKLCIPAELLTKPGRLSREEFNLMKEHSRQGYEILKDVSFPWPVATIVLQHHERLDGTGYPNGSHGDEILPLAKVLAVADVIEAMASNRPHRPALGLGAAMAEVKDHPELFDEDVVAAATRLLDRDQIWL